MFYTNKALLFFFWIIQTSILISTSSASEKVNEKRKVVIIESQGYNEEVWLALAQGVSGLHNVETTIGLAKVSDGVKNLIDDFSWANQPHIMPIHNITSGLLDKSRADIYISVSCDEEMLSMEDFIQNLFEESNMTLFCVAHRASNFKAGSERFFKILPWIKARRIRMLTLSEHVVQSLKVNLGPFQDLTPVSFFAPVFSIHPRLLGREEFPNLQRSEKTRKIVLQGKINYDRRNITQIVREMEQESAKENRIEQGGATLTLLGNGGEVDKGNNANINHIFDLSYPDYFGTMARSDVLLIGNKNEDVLSNEVTSSIAAAMISGTPIVADENFLQAYTYLSADAVIQPTKEQTHLQAAFDFVALPALLHSRKRHAVTTLRKSLLLQNKYRLDRWISLAVN